MRFREELVSEENPGFYKVPGFEWIEIRPDGKIINTDKGFCPFHQLWGGYPAVSIGRGMSMHVHRLLALTFIPNPFIEEPDQLEVNHRDGVKTNNDLENLEWTTWSGNILHAYENGLRSDNRPVLVKDLRSCAISRFYSLSACAREFRMSPSLLCVYLRPYNRGKISRDYYVFIYEGDDWPPLTKDDLGQYRNGTAKLVIATNTMTEKVILFGSIAQAAEFFGCKTWTITKHILRESEKLFYEWDLRYVSNPGLYGK